MSKVLNELRRIIDIEDKKQRNYAYTDFLAKHVHMYSENRLIGSREIASSNVIELHREVIERLGSNIGARLVHGGAAVISKRESAHFGHEIRADLIVLKE